MPSFKPIYGYGWRDEGGSINEPPPFSMAGEVTEHIEGAIAEPDHILSELWIVLARRSPGSDEYGLRAFRSRGDKTPIISGFAQLSLT